LLYNISYANNIIIVVDNGSVDESPNIIKQKYPFVHILQNKHNIGFAGGNNIGISHALKFNPEYVWLLNNDTIVEKDTLTKLVDVMECYSEIGCISPLIYYYDNRTELQFCGSYIDWKNKTIIKLNNVDQISHDMDISLWGTALLIRREVIKKVGDLNEKYFAYHEDEEYSKRVLLAGYKNMVHREARIFHKNSRSTGSNDAPLQVFLRSRNIYFLWMDNLKGINRIKQTPKYLAHIIAYSGLLKEKQLPESISACLDGVWHAFRDIGGPRNTEIKMPGSLKNVFNFMISWHPYFWSSLLMGNVSDICSEIKNKIKMNLTL
jgi:hypothetical protein